MEWDTGMQLPVDLSSQFTVFCLATTLRYFLLHAKFRHPRADLNERRLFGVRIKKIYLYYSLIWRRKLWIALCGGIILEEALNLSSDRILNEWITGWCWVSNWRLFCYLTTEYLPKKLFVAEPCVVGWMRITTTVFVDYETRSSSRAQNLCAPNTG
jgi:hypothetical protein